MYLLSLRKSRAGYAGTGGGDNLDFASARIHAEAGHTGLRLAGKANIPAPAHNIDS